MSPSAIENPRRDIDRMSVSGIEDVCMFEEDYIDPWSDLPLAHFSYLLKKIVPISCLETASYLSTTLCKDNEEVSKVGRAIRRPQG